jgi:sigma-B regulation protein RsbU (phosphoserine phosphatase)
MAREIQKGLLPDMAPEVPGIEIAFAYEPARQLGGDFYDFLSYGDDSLAIIVGDVSGKATPAALYGALTVGILRGHVVHHQNEPAEMLRLTNKQLREPRLDNRFAALAFALYDSRAGTLTIANSGFPRPWLLRGERVEEIPVEGLPLGILPESDYEQKTIELEENDIIVFCSDGLHESMNDLGEELGAGRLQALLAKLSASSAEGIAAELMTASDRHVAGGTEYADDRTVVVLKFGSTG